MLSREISEYDREMHSINRKRIQQGCELLKQGFRRPTEDQLRQREESIQCENQRTGVWKPAARFIEQDLYEPFVKIFEEKQLDVDERHEFFIYGAMRPLSLLEIAMEYGRKKFILFLIEKRGTVDLRDVCRTYGRARNNCGDEILQRYLEENKDKKFCEYNLYDNPLKHLLEDGATPKLFDFIVAKDIPSECSWHPDFIESFLSNMERIDNIYWPSIVKIMQKYCPHDEFNISKETAHKVCTLLSDHVTKYNRFIKSSPPKHILDTIVLLSEILCGEKTDGVDELDNLVNKLWIDVKNFSVANSSIEQDTQRNDLWNDFFQTCVAFEIGLKNRNNAMYKDIVNDKNIGDTFKELCEKKSCSTCETPNVSISLNDRTAKRRRRKFQEKVYSNFFLKHK